MTAVNIASCAIEKYARTAKLAVHASQDKQAAPGILLPHRLFLRMDLYKKLFIFFSMLGLPGGVRLFLVGVSRPILKQPP
jgi:hypothetical protein